MSYLSTFAGTEQKQARTMPNDAELASMVAETLDILPPQSKGIWQAVRLAELQALYADADPFARELYWLEIRQAADALRDHAIRLKSLPVFLASRDGEAADAYLDRCYAASGFLPASGEWQ